MKAIAIWTIDESTLDAHLYEGDALSMLQLGDTESIVVRKYENSVYHVFNDTNGGKDCAITKARFRTILSAFSSAQSFNGKIMVGGIECELNMWLMVKLLRMISSGAMPINLNSLKHLYADLKASGIHLDLKERDMTAMVTENNNLKNYRFLNMELGETEGERLLGAIVHLAISQLFAIEAPTKFNQFRAMLDSYLSDQLKRLAAFNTSCPLDFGFLRNFY